jgi:hypothetical protein
MIKYTTEITSTQVPSIITCDICKKEYNYATDIMEIQEFQHINIFGGYASVFGDGAKITKDICQHCLKKWLDNN